MHCVITGTNTFLRLATAGALLATAAACSFGGRDPVVSPPVAEATACAADKTITPGTILLSTDSPGLPPWWGGDSETQYTVEPPGGSGWEGGDPYSMEGFEGGIAYSLADGMGFQPDNVEWVDSGGVEEALGPGEKSWDAYISHVPVRDSHADNVAFSKPYFESQEGVLVMPGGPLSSADSVSDLKEHKLGAVEFSSGAEMIDTIVQPTTPAQTYEDINAAAAALKAGEIDALVADINVVDWLKNGWRYDDTKTLPDATIIGRVDASVWPDRYAFVLPKGSPLKQCVDLGVDVIDAQNFINEYTGEYIHNHSDVPVIR